MEWAYPSREAPQKCSQRELVFSKSTVSRTWALQHNHLHCAQQHGPWHGSVLGQLHSLGCGLRCSRGQGPSPWLLGGFILEAFMARTRVIQQIRDVILQKEGLSRPQHVVCSGMSDLRHISLLNFCGWFHLDPHFPVIHPEFSLFFPKKVNRHQFLRDVSLKS